MERWYDRALAPGPLGVVQAFVNSADIEDREEGLGSADELRAWLAEHGLLDPETPVDETDVLRVVTLREALRELMRANNGAVPDPAALAALDREVEAVGLRHSFGPDGGATLQAEAPGIGGAVGALLRIVLAAVANGSWSRLKACHRDQCRWAFYDASKNRGGRWCRMAVCGNRAKTRAYRRRQRGG